jgi:hypothetical protein
VTARSVRAILALVVGCALSACASGAGGPLGAGSKVRILDIAIDGARVDAAGRTVAVAPPDGRCLDPDSVKRGQDAAFLMIRDCSSVEGGPIAAVTVGDSPLYGGGDPAEALAALEAWFATPAGLRALGMGGGDGDVRIVETRREGDALFLYVEDLGAEGRPAPGPRFWRVFSEIEGRLSMLSVYDSEGSGAETLYREARRHLAALRSANGNAVPMVAEAPASDVRQAPPPPRPR